MSKWEPFSERGRRSIVLAQEEAQGLGHRYLGAEHLLLGIVAEGDNDSAKVLVANGADLVGLRERVKAIVLGDEAWLHPEMVFGPAAKLAIDRAFSVAREMNHNYIGADHLLLGIIDHGDDPAVRALVAAGIDLTKVRGEVVEAMHSPRKPASAS